ncbi:hypothetical protein BDP27DRAFT_1431457 [Rhodocollybia butyracea]|uniref:Uncharacterized protein n=1 Tax=Rhodocollybia butyracea TaxID=206335 RepID=A0A9P5PBT5_9AGAR|nr:hypothetical protein BDP27DRAFT_1431457 [Rhodocollybia butyracea]
MENSIGNLTAAIHSDSCPFMNLSEKAVVRAQFNTLKSMLPAQLDQHHGKEDYIPSTAEDLGDKYVLLHQSARRLEDIKNAALAKYLLDGNIPTALSTGVVSVCPMIQAVNAKPDFAEIQFYFRFQGNLEDDQAEPETLAMVSRYSKPDAQLLEDSFGTSQSSSSFAFSQQNELGIIMNQLKIQQDFLQNMYTAIGHEFSELKTLIDSPPKWNIPQHQQADFPKISYWAAASYRAAKKSKSKISGSKKSHPAFYLQEKDGTVISAETLEQIHGSIRAMFFDALRLGEAPKTFTQFGSAFLQRYEEQICARYPILSYGEGNWKATEVAKDIYSGWYDMYGPKDEDKHFSISTSTGLKREASEPITGGSKPKRAKIETAPATIISTSPPVISAFSSTAPSPPVTLSTALSSTFTLPLSPISTLCSSPPATLGTAPSSFSTLTPFPAVTLSAALSLILTVAPSPPATLSTAPSSISTLAPSLHSSTPATLSTAPSSISSTAPSPAATSSTAPSPISALAPSPISTLAPSPTATLSAALSSNLAAAPSPIMTLSTAPSLISTLAPSSTATLSAALSSTSTLALSPTMASSGTPPSNLTSIPPQSSTTLPKISASISIPTSKFAQPITTPSRITRSASLAHSSASRMIVPSAHTPVTKRGTVSFLVVILFVSLLKDRFNDDLFDSTSILRPPLSETASTSTTTEDKKVNNRKARRPNDDTTEAKSICKVGWCDANPAGTEIQFTQHWNDLGPVGRKPFNSREAEMKKTKSKAKKPKSAAE